jgi:hypothetical protein
MLEKFALLLFACRFDVSSFAIRDEDFDAQKLDGSKRRLK